MTEKDNQDEIRKILEDDLQNTDGENYSGLFQKAVLKSFKKEQRDFVKNLPTNIRIGSLIRKARIVEGEAKFTFEGVERKAFEKRNDDIVITDHLKFTVESYDLEGKLVKIDYVKKIPVDSNDPKAHTAYLKFAEGLLNRVVSQDEDIDLNECIGVKGMAEIKHAKNEETGSTYEYIDEILGVYDLDQEAGEI